MMRGDGFDLFLADTVVASGNASVTVVGAASVGLRDVAERELSRINEKEPLWKPS